MSPRLKLIIYISLLIIFCYPSLSSTAQQQSNITQLTRGKNTYNSVYRTNIIEIDLPSVPFINKVANNLYADNFLRHAVTLSRLNSYTPLFIIASFYFFIKKWWIGFLLFIVGLAIVAYFVAKYFILKENSKKLYIEQQQFIRNERQRISGEIHDDIGSGLFAIQLFADMASKQRSDVEEIKQISNMINEMTDKINEVIWSTNSESDNLENLLYYIEHQTIKLFQYTDIVYKPDFPFEVPEIIINSQGRRNTYLLIKEIVYNAIKHAKATEVSVVTTVSNGFLVFIIKDNGTGFDPNDIRQNAMGLKNIRSRIEVLQGDLVIENYKGTIVKIKIPLKDGLASKIIQKKVKWYKRL